MTKRETKRECSLDDEFSYLTLKLNSHRNNKRKGYLLHSLPGCSNRSYRYLLRSLPGCSNRSYRYLLRYLPCQLKASRSCHSFQRVYSNSTSHQFHPNRQLRVQDCLIHFCHSFRCSMHTNLIHFCRSFHCSMHTNLIRSYHSFQRVYSSSTSHQCRPNHQLRAKPSHQCHSFLVLYSLQLAIRL